MDNGDEMQRSIRNEVRDVVSVFSEPTAVLAIVKRGPGIDELYCIWGDKYVPDHPVFIAAFSRAALAALARLDVALAAASPVWDTRGEDAIQTPLWHSVELAAQQALAELARETS